MQTENTAASPMKVAIVGASNDRSKYGNRALRGFKAAGYSVYPVNPNCTEVEGLPCYPDLASLPVKPDIITVYTPPRVSAALVPQIAKIGAAEVYFNPGSEDEEVMRLAKQYNVAAIFACSVLARAFFAD
ncbi:MAG: CoA-binding protein [Candidatus Brocadiia bacterium]